jgi:arylsulfatase A-like enzyme
MRARYLIAIVVVAAVGIASYVIVGRFSGGDTSVILISVDTLRPDHLGCYGYDRKTSPAVDQFAEESLVFENCFAQAPTTRPSCGVILSGFFPHELKIFGNRDNLPIEVSTVTEMLREDGYRTLAVVSNFVLGKRSGFDQGFDYYDDRMDEVELVRGVPERIAENTTEAAINLLRLHHKRKFFMWIHYQDPHGPYTPRPPFDAMFVDPSAEPLELEFNATVSGIGGIPSYQRLGDNRDFNYYVSQYDGEIRYFDEHFKRLINSLKDLDLYDTALIILTSDHGEGMGEHDYYFAHGENVYNTLIRVPLIVRYGTEPRGRRKEFAQIMDLVPTILDLTGVSPTTEYRGASLFGELPAGRLAFSEMPGRYTVVGRDLKLIYHDDENEYMLFDMANDLYESRNLVEAQEYEQHLRPLANRMAKLRSEDLLGGSVKRIAPRLTREERKKLKALGYVQ